MYCAASKDESEAFPFQRIVKLDVQTRQYDSWLAPPGEKLCFTIDVYTGIGSSMCLYE